MALNLMPNVARSASGDGIKTIQGNTFDVILKPGSSSLLYLNPPYDSEIGTIRNRRMEAVFLEHTYRWLRMDGVLILVIPFERLHDCTGILISPGLNVFRMTDPDSVQYRQIAVFGVRREVKGSAVENNKRERPADDPVTLSARGSVGRAGELPGFACRSVMGRSHPSNRRGKAQNRGTRRHWVPACLDLCNDRGDA